MNAEARETLRRRKLNKAVKTILDPAPGIRLSGMKLLCGCEETRQADGSWLKTKPCAHHEAEP